MLILVASLLITGPGNNYHADLYKMPAQFEHLIPNNHALKLGTSIGLYTPWMVLSHEMGHYQAVIDSGFTAKIEFVGWAQGITYFYNPHNISISKKDAVSMVASGLNQQKHNAIEIYNQWGIERQASYSQLMLYVLSKTNLSLYSFRSTLFGMDEADDIGNYIKYSKLKITPEIIFISSIVSDLLSVPFLVALYGIGKFIFTGDSLTEIPNFSLGDINVSYPEINLLLRHDTIDVSLSTVLVIKHSTVIELGLNISHKGFNFQTTLYY